MNYDGSCGLHAPLGCVAVIARPLRRSFLARGMLCMRRTSIRSIVGFRLGNDLQNAEVMLRPVWKRPHDRLAHGQAKQGGAHGGEHRYRSCRRVRFVGKHDRNFTALAGVLILESNSTVHRDDIGCNATRIDHDSSLQLGREARMARKATQQFEIGFSDDDRRIVWHGRHLRLGVELGWRQSLPGDPPRARLFAQRLVGPVIRITLFRKLSQHGAARRTAPNSASKQRGHGRFVPATSGLPLRRDRSGQ